LKRKKRSRHIINKKTHFKQRVKDRIGIKLTRSDRRDLLKLIWNKKARFINRSSNNITKWEVYFKEIYFYVIYNKRHKILETAYPKL
jgi:hypothetical protein